ncbi:DUF11 domain-containing protein [Sphingobacterium sp. SGG-5]|uniref:T9SS type B sorting domain-containing protein n=1 Tax=Sphingobacterium sp. SGG-5 TaxID=2710881 RepID=UPI0013EA760D|nr:gliding motility-associated C-terminal domain-containing protein [Sphingobacterium sp. SGG-5]NGM62936.1 DUF11 domain-containing protein [Sphingobacterium sp. SGG-5]
MACQPNYLLYLLILLFSSFRLTAQTGFTLHESLKGNQVVGIVLGGQARLTGGIEDAPDDGWLRLTDARENQIGYAVINESFPSSLGVEIDFEFVIWGGTGADGFSIFLFDANYDPTLQDDSDPYKFKIGAVGGSLGYANNATTSGLSGGYLGVGIDEWGNYTISSGSKRGGAGGTALLPGIGVRGSAESDYAWLTGNVTLPQTLGISNFTLDYKGPIAPRPDPTGYYRRIFLTIDPVYENGQITHYELSTKLQTDINTTPALILDKVKINQIPPDYLKIGFAAATGGSTHIHEVRNLNVTTPADLWVRKSVNREEAHVGDEMIYTVKVMNQFDLQADYLELKDVLPDHFQVEHITYADDGKPGTGIVSGWTPGDLDIAHVILNLAPFSEAVFEIRGRVASVAEDVILVSTATFDATDQTGFSDTKKENNTSLVTTRIIVPKIVIEDESFDMKMGLPLSSEEMNVLENDRIDGVPVDLLAFELLVVLPAQAVDGGEVPELNVSTGNIQLPSRMTVGEYKITYRIVERINPNNYQEGTVSVRIEPNIVIAEMDDFGFFREGQEYRTANVWDNDTWNDTRLDPQEVQLTWVSTAPPGMVLHNNGTVEIRSSTKEGDYILTYNICDVNHPANCSETTVTMRIRNVLAAQDDYYELVIDRGSVVTPSVLENDVSAELSASTSELRLIPGKPSHSFMKMDADGVIFFPEGTRVGRYTYPYTVCELGRPGNCQNVVAVIDIKAKELFAPNIITPNRDGFNDYFEVVGYEYYDKMELLVFNTGGIEVYRNVDYKNNWDAGHLQEDTYYYILYMKKGSQTTVYKGYVLVKR